MSYLLLLLLYIYLLLPVHYLYSKITKYKDVNNIRYSFASENSLFSRNCVPCLSAAVPTGNSKRCEARSTHIAIYRLPEELNKLLQFQITHTKPTRMSLSDARVGIKHCPELVFPFVCLSQSCQHRGRHGTPCIGCVEQQSVIDRRDRVVRCRVLGLR